MPAHSLRLTTRLHVGGFHREIDLTLPTSSAIAEVLPEVLELAEAPQITRPWRASTVGGKALDMSSPLAETGLHHGHVLVLTPAEPVDAPIVRDSAEALVAHSSGRGAVGGLTAAVITGAIMAITLLNSYVELEWALLAGAVLAVMSARQHPLLALPIAALVAYACARLVTGGSLIDAPTWALITAASAALVTLAVLGLVGAVGTRTAGGIGAASAIAYAASIGALLSFEAAAASALVAGVALVTCTPGLVTTLAGLEVPRLPTAGQDLAVADGNPPDTDERARRAGRIHDGMSIGTAAGMLVALGYLASLDGWAPLLLSLAIAGATILHAARHRRLVPAWALSAVGLGALLAAAEAAASDLAAVIVGMVALVAVTAGRWADHIRTMAPTTAAWLERAEFVAVIAVLPLAGWVGGLFALIRGLG